MMCKMTQGSGWTEVRRWAGNHRLPCVSLYFFIFSSGLRLLASSAPPGERDGTATTYGRSKTMVYFYDI